MFAYDTIQEVVSYLDANVGSAPAHSGGYQDGRPIPAIFVDDWDDTNIVLHNTNLSGYDWDEDGTVTAQYYDFPYDLRVELLVRDRDEDNAYAIQKELQSVLMFLSEFPTRLHDDVNDIWLGSGGSPSYQFNEPTETELQQTFYVKTFARIKHEDFDTLEDVKTVLVNSETDETIDTI